MDDQTAQVEWRAAGPTQAVPVSSRFDDPYFSLDDGLAETRHVFLAANHLPARFRPGFRIAELGFGTGLNLFASLLAWRSAEVSGALHFTSFEAYPMAAPDMQRALSAFPAVARIAAPFLEQWATGARQIELPDLKAEIIIGDARRRLPQWQGAADAWFLDGFSPARNPQMWGADLLAEVARHTRPKGTLATYTAAGAVRRGLQDAGLRVERIAGFGRKRHMTAARQVSAPEPPG